MVQEKVQAVLHVLQCDWDKVCHGLVPTQVDRDRLCFPRDVEHQLLSSLPTITKLLAPSGPSNANQVRYSKKGY